MDFYGLKTLEGIGGVSIGYLLFYVPQKFAAFSFLVLSSPII
jgi:hypothetical protein